MKQIVGTAIGKSLRRVTKLRNGAGQALPGLVVERLFPDYYAQMLQQLPEGVAIITGTNGKTTTTKMVVELLRANGKRVLTNPTGSNLTRGINSMLIHQATASGKLPFDIAVLELDEAYARLFAKQVPVRWVLALNVTRDQLDRFGEVDTAGAMIAETMAVATEGIVTNADDSRLLPAAQRIVQDRPQVALKTFGVADAVRSQFPRDDELVAVGGAPTPPKRFGVRPDVLLSNFDGQHASYAIAGTEHAGDFALSGQHNFQNAAAAAALVTALLPSLSPDQLIIQLRAVKPAFGRGEVFLLPNGSTLRVVLVKNPAGFRQALASYLPTAVPIMIAINDNIADSRDVSWLWDVDFASLREAEVFCTSGSRAADMALRLQYDNVATGTVVPELAAALAAYAKVPGDKLLFTTYTAMLRMHAILKQEATAL